MRRRYKRRRRKVSVGLGTAGVRASPDQMVANQLRLMVVAATGAGRRSVDLAMAEQNGVARAPQAPDGQAPTVEAALADQRQLPWESLLAVAFDPVPTVAVQVINRLPCQAGEESSVTRGVKQSGQMRTAKSRTSKPIDARAAESR